MAPSTTNIWIRPTLLLMIGLFTLLSLVHVSDQIAVMSVDFGSEWLKVAIVKPGVPMDIALNKESKRKTPAIVTLKDDERLFGDQAVSAGIAQPHNSYRLILDLLGKKLDSPAVQLYKQRFPYHELIADPDRGTVLFQHRPDVQYSVEELLAMMLNHSREVAQHYAEEPITAAIVVIPAYFNQAERRAMLDVAELAGVKVLQLMSDNAAVALNYGVFRRNTFNETAQYIMFYDMGSSDTTVTIVEYQLTKSTEDGIKELNPQLIVKGVGFDRSLGGSELDFRLRDNLAEKFTEQAKTKLSVYESPRAMAKLLKEATRVKTVLSANSEHYAQVEGLLDDKDFRTKVTRSDLENMCNDIFERVQGPINMALKSSEMTLGEIDQIIIVGGGTRIPKIQEKIVESIKRNDLGKNINADEAAAMGGVYQAAYLSKAFRVKKFTVKEAAVYPIEVEFDKIITTDEGTEEIKTVSRTLFHQSNVFPQRKVMTFNRINTDFTFYVKYGDLSFLDESQQRVFTSDKLMSVSLTGVAEAHLKHKDEDVTEKGIKAHFKMDDSGLVIIDRVESVFEKPDSGEEEEQSTLSKLGSKITSFFRGGQKDSDNVETAEPGSDTENPENMEPSLPEGQATPSSDGENKSAQDDGAINKDQQQQQQNETLNGTQINDTKPETKKAQNKQSTIKEELQFSQEIKDLPNLSTKSISLSKSRLRELSARDFAKVMAEKLRNDLEAFIHETNEKLYSEQYEQITREEERESIRAKLLETSDWIYDEGEFETAAVYEERLNSLKDLCKDIFFRAAEAERRPEALDVLEQMLNYSKIILTGVRKLSEEEQVFTDAEIAALDKIFTETMDWKNETLAEQKALPPYETPILLTSDIITKVSALEREVQYLMNKQKIASQDRAKKLAEKLRQEAAAATAAAEEEERKAEETQQDTETDVPLDTEPAVELPMSAEESAVSADPAKEPAVSAGPAKEPALTAGPAKEPAVTADPAKEPAVTIEDTAGAADSVEVPAGAADSIEDAAGVAEDLPPIPHLKVEIDNDDLELKTDKSYHASDEL